jgi:hypothetical protein
MAPVGAGEPTLGRAASDLGSLMGLLQVADMTPTIQAVTACEQTLKAFNGLMATWKNLKTTGLEELNASLRKAGQPALTLALPKKD